jgi:hypothetical protein
MVFIRSWNAITAFTELFLNLFLSAKLTYRFYGTDIYDALYLHSTRCKKKKHGRLSPIMWPIDAFLVSKFTVASAFNFLLPGSDLDHPSFTLPVVFVRVLDISS